MKLSHNKQGTHLQFKPLSCLSQLLVILSHFWQRITGWQMARFPLLCFLQWTGWEDVALSHGLPAPPRCAAPPRADWTAARRRRTPGTDWSRRSWAAEGSAEGKWWWVRRRPLLAPPPLPSLGGVRCAAPTSVEHAGRMWSLLLWMFCYLLS